MPMYRSGLAVAALVSLISQPVALASPTHSGYEEHYLSRTTVAEHGSILPGKDRDILFATYTLEPGTSTAWHHDHGGVVFSVNRGELTVVEGDACTARAVEAGQATSTRPGGQHLLRNEGDGPAEVVAVHVSLPPGGPAPYVEPEGSGPACAGLVGAPPRTEVLARGPFDTKGQPAGRFAGDGTRAIDLAAGTDVTFQIYTFPARQTSTWINHPGPAAGIVTRGVMRSYEGHDGECHTAAWEAGKGLLVFPEHPHWETNDSDDLLTFVSVYVNVRRGDPYPVVGNLPDNVEFRAAPASCPVPPGALGDSAGTN